MLRDRRIVLVEDDPIMGDSLLQRLTLEGAEVQWHRQMARALPAIRTPRRPVDAVICDIRLPDGTGEELYQTLLETSAPPPFLFITGQSDVAQAVRLIRSGAADYITKPFEIGDLLAKLALVMPPPPGDDAFAQTGISPLARAVDRQVRAAARGQAPVLVRGRPGLGKLRLARWIHEHSDRRAAPLVIRDLLRAPLGPDALSEAAGAAGEGSLVLVGIGRLPAESQDRLAALLPDASFRLIGTAGMGLQDRVRAGGFRADLFDRLSAHAIVIPPLAERPQDAVWLALRLFAARNRGRRRGMSEAALAAIRAHDWPGNGRELRARIDRALEAAEGDLVMPVDLFPEAVEGAAVRPLSEVREAAERAHIAAVLAQTGGRISEAARLLRVSRTTLWEKMQRLGLSGTE